MGKSGTTTIYEVASKAGVSAATVSRALRDDPRISAATKAAVAQAASELNFVPSHAARALAVTRTHTLGLVLPHIAGPYYADLLVGFETTASAQQYSVTLTLANPGEDASRSVRNLGGQVDGIAFLARSGATDTVIDQISRTCPVVTAARPRVGRNDAFFVHNSAMTTELTQHLIEQERQRIGFVGLPEPGSDLGRRRDGYLRAVHAAGLEPTTFEVFPAEADGIAFAEQLLRSGLHHDALVCGNDELALAVMQTLQRHGVRIPDDLAITGWDDTVAARYVTPGLTTVSQPVLRLGGLVAQRLIQRIAGDAPADEDIVLPATLAHRTSCGCRDTRHDEDADHHAPPSTKELP